MDKPASRHFSVLIIDDEPQVTSELRELLENSGYRCVTSTHRESAIASFQADPNIGLVICDLYLGQDNGIRLIESLKEVAGNGRFFESIILTGHDGRQEVIEAMRVGAADYYQKPVAPQELLHGLERLENRLHERVRSQLSLSHVNQRLEYLAESLNSIYRDIHKIKYEVHGNSQPSALKSEDSQPSAPPASVAESQVSPSNPLFGKLSPRPQAVARLGSKGRTNYQIAYDLGITENTVKLYVSQVLRLMHMHNRTQLALALSPAAMQQGSGAVVH
ncbi:two-component response regulator PprB [Pseudomonas aeruginosa]|nr:two-component response regulator PprB [Pseudomonas aeruginosa]